MLSSLDPSTSLSSTRAIAELRPIHQKDEPGTAPQTPDAGDGGQEFLDQVRRSGREA